MDKYYINISNKEEFDIWLKQLESLWYKMYNDYIDDTTNWCLKYWNIIWSDDWMIRFSSKFNQLNHEWYIYLSLLKVWSLVTIWNNKTVYKIETISKDIATIVNLKTRNRYDYKLDKLKLYTWETTEDKFKVWDIVKVIDVWYMVSNHDKWVKHMWLTKFVKSDLMYNYEQKETILKHNYYKVIWLYKDCKYEILYVWIENCIDWNQYIISEQWIEHTLTSNLTCANTWISCIDYPISYVDTSTVTVDKQWNIKNNLLNNNNTMEKLNQLRADKFFANENNLVAIEALDTLLKDSIELIAATHNELDRVQSKLIWLERKLESATNNQDVAMLKDLIASNKVVQEFVDELKGKTISKFETAKTKFDIAWYLKD